MEVASVVDCMAVNVFITIIYSLYNLNQNGGYAIRLIIAGSILCPMLSCTMIIVM